MMPVLTLLALAPISPGLERALAFEMGTGFSVIEEGDDRLRPGAHLHLSPTPFFHGRAYVWGREYGPVQERTVLVTGARRWGIFRSNVLSASLGLALLSESTKIDFPDSDDFDRDQTQYNAGPLFGIQWTLTDKGPLFAAFSWDSHIFMAGLSGGIFLSYGRKQTLSFSLGARL